MNRDCFPRNMSHRNMHDIPATLYTRNTPHYTYIYIYIYTVSLYMITMFLTTYKYISRSLILLPSQL